MRVALSVIAIVLFLGSILVNLVSEDLAARLSGWLGPNYEPVIYIALVFVLALHVWLFVRDRVRSRPSAQSRRLRAEFEAIWPGFFETLEEDLRRSQASAELARIRAKDRKSHPGIEIRSSGVATRFTVYHQRTVSEYDNELGALLQKYLRASDKLRLSANAYNQFLYADLHKGQDFETTPRLEVSLDYQSVKDEMYEKSRALENALDALNLKLRYYRDLRPGVPRPDSPHDAEPAG